MTAKIITIAQQKGGAGKTTLIVHLATFWSGQGLSVAVADIDPQGSVTQWAKLRAEKQGRAAPFVLPVTGWRTAAEVERLAKTYDIVLIDSPPHAATEARIAVRAAHQVLIPLQPSVLDLWATKATLDLAAEEKRPAQLVLNRVPPRGKAAQEVVDEAARQGLPLSAFSIGNRTAFAASLAAGLGISEFEAAGVAAQEIAALAGSVYSLSSARDLP
jgi:chromosome partitioning protein